MAYNIEKTYTSFGGGISDDNFLGSEYAVKDLDGIDVQTQEGYAQASEAYLGTFTYPLYSGAPTWVKKTPVGTYRGNTGEVLNQSGVQLSGTIGTVIDRMESYGSGANQVNYFFDRTDGIKVTNYLGTSLTTTITTNYPTANVEVTAVGWHVTNLLFAKENKIYYADTATNSIPVASSTPIVTLTPGTVVKYIYSYSYNSIVVVTTNGDDTFIYELEFTGGGYNITSKVPIIGYLALDATGNRYDTFIITEFGIFQYQGQQISDKPDKYLLLSPSARCGYDRGVIIGDGTSVYKFRAIKPGRNMALSRYTLTQSVIDIDGDSILTLAPASNSTIQAESGVYARTNTIKLLPVTGGAVGILKKDLNFQLGYMFDLDSYTNSATRQAVVVKVQTDGMGGTPAVEIARVTDGDTLDSLGNKRYGYMKLAPQMVTDALTTASITTEWLYANVTIELLAGDKYASPAGYYRKTPKLFDFTVKANFKNV